jgi:type II secretory pathway predicted ATPase ExeA
LTSDPFLGAGAPYVPTSGHEEAVARLAETIECGQRLAVLRAGSGMGKSAVVARAIATTRAPNRRFARVNGPVDGLTMLIGLASGLRTPVARDATRPAAWSALTDALRLCRWQRIQPVLVVDDAHLLDDPAGLRDLRRLAHLDPSPSSLLTVVLAWLDPDDHDASAGCELTPPPAPAWQLAIGLTPLTRTETARFVAEKLAAAGRTEPAFTPPALDRLHELSGGIPRGIDRLGSLALMAGAWRGAERVTPEVVDGAAGECVLPWPGFAA